MIHVADVIIVTAFTSFQRETKQECGTCVGGDGYVKQSYLHRKKEIFISDQLWCLSKWLQFFLTAMDTSLSKNRTLMNLLADSLIIFLLNIFYHEHVLVLELRLFVGFAQLHASVF